MEYISLKEAQKYCRHSQDYLKLRARQGKLKALKIGRNWVTMREWVEAYGGKRNLVSSGKLSFAGVRSLASRGMGARSLASPRKPGFNLPLCALGLALAALTAFLFLEPAYFKWAIAGLGHIIPGRVVEL